MRHSERPQPALGKAIRQLRQKRGLTQVALGEKAGITGRSLSLIERGHANPTWGTAKGIAKALDVSMGELGKLTDSFDTEDLPQGKRFRVAKVRRLPPDGCGQTTL